MKREEDRQETNFLFSLRWYQQAHFFILHGNYLSRYQLLQEYWIEQVVSWRYYSAGTLILSYTILLEDTLGNSNFFQANWKSSKFFVYCSWQIGESLVSIFFHLGSAYLVFDHLFIHVCVTYWKWLQIPKASNILFLLLNRGTHMLALFYGAAISLISGLPKNE